MIIPESERSKAPLVGEKVFSHPDMVRANEYVLGDYAPPVRKVCIFVPCATAAVSPIILNLTSSKSTIMTAPQP